MLNMPAGKAAVINLVLADIANRPTGPKCCRTVLYCGMKCWQQAHLGMTTETVRYRSETKPVWWHMAAAGVSVQYGASNQISSDGITIVVGTAALADQMMKYTYVYRLDDATNRFAIVSAIKHGEQWPDPWTLASTMGVSTDNGLALSQSGSYLLRVEGNMLVVYQASGKGLSWNFVRRCAIASPVGYLWRSSKSTADVGGSALTTQTSAHQQHSSTGAVDSCCTCTPLCAVEPVAGVQHDIGQASFAACAMIDYVQGQSFTTCMLPQ